MPNAAPVPLIEGVGLTVIRNGEPVLDHVDIAIASGETVTIVGPNGAGKTTLLRVLMGLMRPHSGTVTRRPGLRIGYLPQQVPIDPALPLTVRRLLSLRIDATNEARLQRLAEVGARDLVDRSVHTLSGGELRRVLLARALLREPDLLVLDEPVQGVDITGQAELYGLIAQVARARTLGVLMVSHELHFVMATTDRVLCLNHHVCCAGAPESVRAHPEYRALFGGEAAGVAVYHHHHDHKHGASGEVVPLPHTHTEPHNPNDHHHG